MNNIVVIGALLVTSHHIALAIPMADPRLLSCSYPLVVLLLLMVVVVVMVTSLARAPLASPAPDNNDHEVVVFASFVAKPRRGAS